MFTAISIGIAYLISIKLEDLSQYKEPKGKNRNRYK